MAFTEDITDFFDTDDFADAAVFTPPGGVAVNTTVIVNRNVQVAAGGGSYVTEPRTVIDCMVADVGEPKRGATIVIAAGIHAGTYTVESIADNDGMVVRVMVK